LISFTYFDVLIYIVFVAEQLANGNSASSGSNIISGRLAPFSHFEAACPGIARLSASCDWGKPAPFLNNLMFCPIFIILTPYVS
jgi:hypothetical protein